MAKKEKQNVSLADIQKIKELIRNSKYKTGLKLIEKLLIQDPENALLFYIRGNIFHWDFNKTEALKNYTKAIALDPNFKEAYQSRAVLFRDRFKNMNAAKKDFNKFERLRRKFTELKHKKLGPAKSLKDFTKVPRIEIKYTGTKKTDPVTRWGGYPNNWKGFKWPICSGCGQPMSFALQVSAAQVDLKGNKAMQLFTCVEGDCLLPRPSSSLKKDLYASKLFLIKTPLANETITAQTKVRILKSTLMKLEESTEPGNDARKNEDDRISSKSFDMAFIDKFYGIIATGNRIEEIPCSICSHDMILFGQFLKGDLNGIEDFFISIITICPKGHEAIFQMVKG